MDKYKKATSTLKHFAHPISRAIIKQLLVSPQCVKDIYSNIGREQSVTSKFLNLLKADGVLYCERQGRQIIYRTTPAIKKLEKIVDELNAGGWRHRSHK